MGMRTRGNLQPGLPPIDGGYAHDTAITDSLASCRSAMSERWRLPSIDRFFGDCGCTFRFDASSFPFFTDDVKGQLGTRTADVDLIRAFHKRTDLTITLATE
jgi:hypothetical protein